MDKINFSSSESHWEDVYLNNDSHGWSQEQPVEIESLIEETNLSKNSKILCAGAGDSSLIDVLYYKEFNNIIANDISKNGLQKIKSRLGENGAISYVVDDLLSPTELLKFNNSIDLWIDRATLHFFKEEKDQKAYLDIVNKVLKPGAFIIIGVFSEENEPICSGLPLQLWNLEGLTNFLSGFNLLNSFNSKFIPEKGRERNYLFGLYRKKLK